MILILWSMATKQVSRFYEDAEDTYAVHRLDAIGKSWQLPLMSAYLRKLASRDKLASEKGKTVSTYKILSTVKERVKDLKFTDAHQSAIALLASIHYRR